MSIQMPPTGWRFERITEHPGEMIREEYMVPLGLSTEQLAEKLGVTVRDLDDFLQERVPLSVEMAMRLSRCFNTPPQFFLNIQQLHDISKTQQELGARIESEVTPVHISEAA